MANKYQKYYKEEKKGRVLKAFAAVALSAVLLAGGCAVGFGAGTNWTFKRSSAEAAQPANPKDETGIQDNVLLTDVESNGIKLMSERIAPDDFDEYGISAQAETAQVLTAIFTPENATFKDVEWSVSGGQNKVTVNPVAGQPLQATVSVAGAFSEQARVTCTSTYDTNIKGVSTVDYLMTPSYSIGNAPCTVNSIKDTMHTTLNDFFKNNSTGTLRATRVSGTVGVYIDQDLYYDYLKGRHPSLPASISLGDRDLTNETLEFKFDDFLTGMSASEKASVYADIARYYQGSTHVYLLDVDYANVNFYYGDTSYCYWDGDGMGGNAVYVESLEDITVHANGIEMDKNLVFFPPEQAQ